MKEIEVKSIFSEPYLGFTDNAAEEIKQSAEKILDTKILSLTRGNGEDAEYESKRIADRLFEDLRDGAVLVKSIVFRDNQIKRYYNITPNNKTLLEKVRSGDTHYSYTTLTKYEYNFCKYLASNKLVTDEAVQSYPNNDKSRVAGWAGRKLVLCVFCQSEAEYDRLWELVACTIERDARGFWDSSDGVEITVLVFWEPPCNGVAIKNLAEAIPCFEDAFWVYFSSGWEQYDDACALKECVNRLNVAFDVEPYREQNN